MAQQQARIPLIVAGKKGQWHRFICTRCLPFCPMPILLSLHFWLLHVRTHTFFERFLLGPIQLNFFRNKAEDVEHNLTGDRHSDTISSDFSPGLSPSADLFTPSYFVRVP